ncbi:MAG: signal peptide peptidase SppA [Balneolales bacterium]
MSFFKNLLASMLGFFIAFFLLFLIVMFVAISAQSETEPHIREGSVLNISLTGLIPERPAEDPFSELFMGKPDASALSTLSENFNKAASDHRIDGIWLEINMLSTPWATLEEIHKAILDFKENSGKFVYASTDDMGFNEQGYYIATAADSIFSPPETMFLLDGFFIQTVFFKNMLDKVGVEPQVLESGAYKTAFESFTHSEYSMENAEQLQAIIDLTADEFLNAVSKKTGLSVAELNDIMNEAPRLTANFAFEAGLLDELIYRSETKDRVDQRVRSLGRSDVHHVKSSRYEKVTRRSAGIERANGNEKIAIIHLDGVIMPQSLGPRQATITAENFRSHIKEIREDENIKAIVLRINSPGGSASTSDVIWKMVREISQELPVIASMGPVAASGGYYISAAADTIIASANTITGSIGVISTRFNVQELMNDKLGITFDEVKTHNHANWMNPVGSLSEIEERAFKSFGDEFYEVFLNRVALGRNMGVEEVHLVAQGRVWTGYDALEHNLVDMLGGLDLALHTAAEKAGLAEYHIETFPKPKSVIELLTGSAQIQAMNLFNLDYPGKQAFEATQGLLMLNGKPHVLALLPFEISVN